MKFLLFIILPLFLFSCNPDGGKQNVDSPEIPENNFTKQELIDSLVFEKDNLEASLSELQKGFDFKQQDLKGRSYYHKNWEGHYYLSDEALLAGVDSTGKFFLIANVWSYAHLNTNLDEIQIIIDSSVYSAKKDVEPPYVNNTDVLCACGFHQACFSNKDALKIAEAIAENPEKKIVWTGIKTLTKRDIVGIKESFELSVICLRLQTIDERLQELNK